MFAPCNLEFPSASVRLKRLIGALEARRHVVSTEPYSDKVQQALKRKSGSDVTIAGAGSYGGHSAVYAVRACSILRRGNTAIVGRCCYHC
jgi:hypothetical protein